jgi:CrcB protein
MADRPEAEEDHDLPLDPDIDAEEDRRPPPEAGSPFAELGRRRFPRLHRDILTVVFVGGIVGGLARYGMTKAWPTPDAGFPWATFVVNTLGAFGLALLVALIADVLASRRLLRPAVGTGFFGAFTTFSSVVTTSDHLMAHGHAQTGWIYLAGSTVAALGAVSFGLLLGRAVAVSHDRDREDQR